MSKRDTSKVFNINMPRADWRQEVANGDTVLGYEEWVAHQIEAETPEPNEDRLGFGIEHETEN